MGIINYRNNEGRDISLRFEMGNPDLKLKTMMTDNSLLIKSIAVTAVVVMLIIGFGGCTPVEHQSGPTEKLQILTHRMVRLDDGRPVIKGTAKNVSSSTLKYAEVEVEFLDNAADTLEISRVNTSNLSAGEIWNFEVTYNNFNPENVSDYQIRPGTIR